MSAYDHRLYILDDDGNPVRTRSLMRWGEWMASTRNERRVVRNKIGDVLVSTVFLGLDHGYGSGPPILWETMIFGGKHDRYQERYSTRADAEAGHQRAVFMVSESVSADVPIDAPHKEPSHD